MVNYLLNIENLKKSIIKSNSDNKMIITNNNEIKNRIINNSN